MISGWQLPKSRNVCMHNFYTQALGITGTRPVQNQLETQEIAAGFPRRPARNSTAWAQSLNKFAGFTVARPRLFHRQNSEFQSVIGRVIPAIHRAYNNNNYVYKRIV